MTAEPDNRLSIMRNVKNCPLSSYTSIGLFFGIMLYRYRYRYRSTLVKTLDSRVTSKTNKNQLLAICDESVSDEILVFLIIIANACHRCVMYVC